MSQWKSSYEIKHEGKHFPIMSCWSNKKLLQCGICLVLNETSLFKTPIVFFWHLQWSKILMLGSLKKIDRDWDWDWDRDRFSTKLSPFWNSWFFLEVLTLSFWIHRFFLDCWHQDLNQESCQYWELLVFGFINSISMCWYFSTETKTEAFLIGPCIELFI
jgi:hypothetical protein